MVGNYQLGETDDRPICEAIHDGYSKDSAGPGIFVRGFKNDSHVSKETPDLRECVAIGNYSPNK